MGQDEQVLFDTWAMVGALCRSHVSHHRADNISYYFTIFYLINIKTYEAVCHFRIKVLMAANFVCGQVFNSSANQERVG